MGKHVKKIGWTLSLLLAALLIFGSASGKFTEWEGKSEMFGKLGWSTETMFGVGVVEVVVTLMFLIPRTAFLGAILLTAYLGGAVSAHVRIGEPFVIPIIMGILVWVALGLRDRRVFNLALEKAPTP